jgi:hypothetical protein
MNIETNSCSLLWHTNNSDLHCFLPAVAICISIHHQGQDTQIQSNTGIRQQGHLSQQPQCVYSLSSGSQIRIWGYNSVAEHMYVACVRFYIQSPAPQKETDKSSQSFCASE